MSHIKSKNTDSIYYYILNTEGDLSSHHAIVNHADFWEVVEGNPPEDADGFIYQEI